LFFDDYKSVFMASEVLRSKSMSADDKILIISAMARRAQQLWGIVPPEIIAICSTFCEDIDIRYHLPDFRVAMMGGSSAFQLALMAGINEEDHSLAVKIGRRPCVMRLSMCQDEFFGLQDTAICAANGFVLAYNVHCRASFRTAQEWMCRIKRRRDEWSNRPTPLVLVAVATGDQNNSRLVTQSEGERQAAEWECPFFELRFELGSSPRGTLPCFEELGKMMNQFERQMIIDQEWGAPTPRGDSDRCHSKKCVIL